mgnify:CR=1 FL=1
MPNRSLRLVGRVEQSAIAQVIERKPPARAFTAQVEEQILYRWRFAGQSTRQISRGLRLNDREAVEAVIQRRMNGRGPVMPATRRVA